MIKNLSPESYACIFVREIAVDVRIGLYEAEKKAPQRVLVSAELYTGPGYLKREGILDYEKVYDFVQSWGQRPHVELIETYVEETLKFVFGFEEVRAAKISIAKQDIFEKANAAGVEVFLMREEFTRLTEQ
jgi:dihydroneopterin aldolase